MLYMSDNEISVWSVIVTSKYCYSLCRYVECHTEQNVVVLKNGLSSHRSFCSHVCTMGPPTSNNDNRLHWL